MKETFDLFCKEVPPARFIVAKYVDGNGKHVWVIQERIKRWFLGFCYTDMSEKSQYYCFIRRRGSKDDRDFGLHEFDNEKAALEEAANLIQEVERFEKSKQRTLVDIKSP